jgi:hypothetical protein
MGVTDIIIMAVIIAGAIYLLYHSLRKKKGHCTGCNSDSCEKRH